MRTSNSQSFNLIKLASKQLKQKQRKGACVCAYSITPLSLLRALRCFITASKSALKPPLTVLLHYLPALRNHLTLLANTLPTSPWPTLKAKDHHSSPPLSIDSKIEGVAPTIPTADTSDKDLNNTNCRHLRQRPQQYQCVPPTIPTDT